MELGVATLVAGTETLVGEGVTGAVRCIVELEPGVRRRAVLKRGPVGQVAAEAFCSLLLRAWGLPVPEPFIVQEITGPAFASVDVGYPNLKQHIGLEGLPDGPEKQAAIRVCCELAMSFPSTPLAASIDEAIDNRDRNLGNILWDGAAEMWIDHAFAVGQATMHDRNKLCEIAVFSGHAERIRTGAVAQSLTIDRHFPAVAEDATSEQVAADGLASYVAARVSGLGARILARFPQPADLLA